MAQLEFGCYAYGGMKRKRKQGDCLRSALEAHVREHLNMGSLKTQDRKLMAWTLGELAFFAYTSAIEEQDSSGVPATQAIRNTDFFEVATLIASERGVQDQTPEPVLRRVSANMATRFWESRLAEALESFIALHGPPIRNVVSRAAQPAPAQPQRRNPPVAPRSYAAPAATAAPSAPAQPQPREIAPAPGTETSAGPSQPRAVRTTHCGPPSPPAAAPRGGWRPLVRSHGTQTWAPSAGPTAQPRPWPDPKEESEDAQGAGPLGPLPTPSAAGPSRPSAVRHVAGGVAGPAAAYGSQHGAATAADQSGYRPGPATAAADEAPSGEVGADREEDLPYTQRSGAACYDREALRQQLLQPLPLGPSRHHPSHPPHHHQANAIHDSRSPQRLTPPPPQQQQQQPHHQGRPASRSHGRPGPDAYTEGPENAELLLLQQRCAACQTTPSSRDAAAAAAAAAARRASWSAPDELAEEPSPRPQQQQQPHHSQAHAGRQAGRQGEGQERWQAPRQLPERAAQRHPHPQQAQQQPQQQLQQPLSPPPQPHQQQQGHTARSGLLKSGRVTLARRADTDAQPAPSSAAAAAAAGGGGGRGPGRDAGGERRLVLAQSPANDGRRTGGDGGAGPSAMAAAVAVAGLAVGGALAEPQWNQLRREYEKRSEAGALEARLRKHLLKKGNSMIKKYCHKEGLPWTLLEVACYGVALQKLAPHQPFDVESVVRFLARVKGWRQGDGAAAGAEPRGPYEAPPPALVQKVAAVMAAAVAKYDLPSFIERQRRDKKPAAAVAAAVLLAQQQAAVIVAGTATQDPPGTVAAAPVPAAAGGAPHAHRRSALPYNSNHPSPAETLSIGVTAPPAATTTTAHHQHQYGVGSPGGSGGGSSGGSMRSGSASGDGDIGGGGAQAAIADSAAAAATVGGGGGGLPKRVRVKASTKARKKGSRGSSAGGGGRADMELRLRKYLARQGVSKLRRRNASEGVGWTLLDLAEADRAVRLQQDCDYLDAAEVVGRLLRSKLAPGKELSPRAIQAVTSSVCEAHDKFRLGDFVAGEVNKRRKRKWKRTGQAAAAAAAGGGAAAGG